MENGERKRQGEGYRERETVIIYLPETFLTKTQLKIIIGITSCSDGAEATPS